MHQPDSTESSSHYDHLETKSVKELITAINKEDASIAKIVREALPQIEQLIIAACEKMTTGGRLFYIGAGTSGRLGILDASEIPPTYGIDDNVVIGVIAGGDNAIKNAVEFAEDDISQAWKDLQLHHINSHDFLIGIAASGETPYVFGGIDMAAENGISTGCIVCNPNRAIAQVAEYPVELNTGAEFVSGSTRMKAGTAQKMVLNMISTSLMIQLGKVSGNKMVEMKLSNNKLWNRAATMLSAELNISNEAAVALVKKHGNVKQALKAYRLTRQILL